MAATRTTNRSVPTEFPLQRVPRVGWTLAAAHAKSAHGLDSIPPDVVEKVRGAIHDEVEPAANVAGAS